MQTAADSPAPPLLDSGPPGKMFPQQQTRKKKEQERKRDLCVCVWGDAERGGGMSRFTEHTFTAHFFPPFIPINSLLLSEGGVRCVHKHLRKHQAHTDIGSGEMPDRQTRVSQTDGRLKSRESAAGPNDRQMFLYRMTRPTSLSFPLSIFEDIRRAFSLKY